MDRDLSSAERRRERLRRVAPWAAAGALAIAAAAVLPGWVRPAVGRDRLRVGVVDRGPVEDARQASGTVVPTFEASLVSPVEARVLRILREPGARVAAGDPLVELDLSAAELADERAEEELAQKRAEAETRPRELARETGGKATAVREAELEVEMAAFRLEQQRRLHAEGLSAEAPLREAEAAHEKAALALAQARRDLASAREDERTTAAALAREVALLVKERAETARLLELGVARADRDGVVTWILGREGIMVGRGEELARVADLSRFGIEGRIASVHADRLAPGLPARVDLDRQTRLDGVVASVDPTIEEGTARFRVQLDEPSHSKLRNHLRVDVWVVADRRASALRVPKGPFAAADGGRTVLVVDGDRLTRRRVRLGLSGVDHYEVEEGLAPGERVVLSNLDEYSHLQEIRLK